MKHLILAVSILMVFNYNAGAQTSSCAVIIGGVRYIECKHIIMFGDNDILTFAGKDSGGIGINFDVFSEKGIKTARVESGKLVYGDKLAFDIKNSKTEFTFMEVATNRIICYVKKVNNPQSLNCELHLWADMFMPEGFYFQCTPETTNVPFLNQLKGATFSNNETAIRLQ